MKKIILVFLISLLASCQSDGENSNNHIYELSQALNSNPELCELSGIGVNISALAVEKCNWLSNFRLFLSTENNDFIPNDQVIKYELNSTLFTDFSDKQRFLYIPNNTQANFKDLTTFEFPLNTVLIKVFSLKQHKQSTPIEIRLLIKKEFGWVFLPYIWLEEKQDAFLYRNGYQLETFVDINEQRAQFTYNIPSQAICGECHQVKNESGDINFQPIGLKARHLNRSIEYQGQFINQLILWKQLNLIKELPDDLNSIDTAPNWHDESKNIQDRAKAYLDINCAHCHNDYGSAALSGLRLEYWRKSISHTHGVCNSSHGWRGGGFDIWPGRGEISSIPIRMRHTEPKDRMPPIGRSLVDEEAAQLISDWIDTLPYESCAE